MRLVRQFDSVAVSHQSVGSSFSDTKKHTPESLMEKTTMQLFSFGSRKPSANLVNVHNQMSTSKVTSKLALLGCVVAAGVVTLGLASSAQAQTACNGGATLNGSYGLFANGTQALSTNLKALTGTVVFDGKCGLTGKLTANENAGLPAAFTATTGSYNTNADGTIALNLAIPGTTKTETYVLSYLPAFHELLGNETDGSAYAQIDLKALVSAGSAVPPVYTAANLKGTFVASGVYSDMVTFTFDGVGGLTAVDRSSGNPQGLAATGTYKMYGTDGSFGGSVSVGSTTFYYGAVLDADTNEFQMVVNSGPANYAGVESFVAKRIS